MPKAAAAASLLKPWRPSVVNLALDLQSPIPMLFVAAVKDPITVLFFGILYYSQETTLIEEQIFTEVSTHSSGKLHVTNQAHNYIIFHSFQEKKSQATENVSFFLFSGL
jgi:hypothetical protein